MTPFSTPWLRELRRGLGETNGKPVLMAGFQVTADQRTKIEAAIVRMRAHLTPGREDVEHSAMLVGRVLAPYRERDKSTSTMLAADVYIEAIAGQPSWAVDAACKRFNAGRTKLDAAFPPMPAQLAELVYDEAAPARRDLTDLERLLEAAADPPPVRSAFAAPWSRTWWALFHSYVETHIAELRDQASEAHLKLARVASLAISRVGWKVEPAELTAAEERGKSFVVVFVDSPDCQAWQRYFAGLGVNMPLPIAAPVWMPESIPPDARAVDAELRAERAETEGDN